MRRTEVKDAGWQAWPAPAIALVGAGVRRPAASATARGTRGHPLQRVPACSGTTNNVVEAECTEASNCTSSSPACTSSLIGTERQSLPCGSVTPVLNKPANIDRSTHFCHLGRNDVAQVVQPDISSILKRLHHCCECSGSQSVGVQRRRFCRPRSETQTTTSPRPPSQQSDSREIRARRRSFVLEFVLGSRRRNNPLCPHGNLVARHLANLTDRRRPSKRRKTHSAANPTELERRLQIARTSTSVSLRSRATSFLR